MNASNSSRLIRIPSRYLLVSDARCRPCARRNSLARSWISVSESWMPAFFAAREARRSRTNCSRSESNCPVNFRTRTNSVRSIASPSIFTSVTICFFLPHRKDSKTVTIPSSDDFPERVESQVDKPALAHDDFDCSGHAVSQWILHLPYLIVVALQRYAPLVHRRVVLRSRLGGRR